MPQKTWVSGETILASDLSSLSQQTVITCTSSTRPSSPVNGMTIYQTDTNTMFTWRGSAWVATAVSAQAGMVMAIPSTISGTGASLSGCTITLSNCAAVVINGIFTANYNDYLVNIRMSQSGSDVNMRLTSGGTEVDTLTYNWSMMQAYQGAGVSTQRQANTSSMLVMSNNNGSTGSAAIDIFGPQLASPTMFQVNNLRNDGNLQTPANYLLYGNNTNSTSYDGIRIFGPSNMTGTVSLYARAK